MSSLSSPVAPTAVPIVPPPPPGLNYIAAIQPSLTLLIISVVFLGMFIPLLITLFLLSTRELRHKLIFMLNVFALLLGLALGSTSTWAQISAILRPLDQTKGTIAAASLTVFSPVLVESILFVRLFTVYPWSSISAKAKLAVYAFPVALKVGRTINSALGLAQAIKVFDARSNPISSPEQTWQETETKVECILHLIDNSYTSALFLWKLRQAAQLAKTIKLRSSKSYTKRIRTLTWIVASNFIIPDLLSLVQLIVLFLGPTFNVGIYIFGLTFINPCMEIISVLFATVWAASNHWQSAHDSPPPTFSLGLSTYFGDAPPTSSRGSRIIRTPTPNAMIHSIALEPEVVEKASTADLSAIGAAV